MVWGSLLILQLSCVVLTQGGAVRYEYGPYGPWTPCSRTCGQGETARVRPCALGPCPVDGLIEKKPCNRQECKIEGTVICSDCYMIEGQCIKRCGTNRQRPCQYGPGNKCWFPTHEIVRCGSENCVGGVGSGAEPTKWAEWTSFEEWKTCRQDCQQLRYRKCGGDICPGEDYESRECFGGECPIEYGAWGPWQGDCDATCSQTRRRQCYKGACDRSVESRECMEGPCTVPVWDDWVLVSECSPECLSVWRRVCLRGRCPDPPEQLQTRNCRKGEGACAAKHSDYEWEVVGGCNTDCLQPWRGRCVNHSVCSDEVIQEERTCTGDLCTGGWESWGDWSACTADCMENRSRRCRLGPNRCQGTSQEQRRCSRCLGAWGPWVWSECNVETCREVGRRTCEPAGAECLEGASEDERVCEDRSNCANSERSQQSQPETKHQGCAGRTVGWDQWSQWSDCVAKCGPSWRTRERQCCSDIYDGCEGKEKDRKRCDGADC